MARAVHPQTAAGPDGAVFSNWRRWFAEACRWPWFDATVPTASRPAHPLTPEPFESLKAFAASGQAGCVKARAKLKVATNRGLAAALGRELPKVLAR